MENVIKNNDTRFVLKGKIKGLAEESKRARVGIAKAKTKEAALWIKRRKEYLGSDVRHHLLAYAFLRGKAYKEVERACDESNKPNVNLLFTLVEGHAPFSVTYTSDEGRVTYKRYLVTLEQVKAWVEGASNA